jgi:hypothetical protein
MKRNPPRDFYINATTAGWGVRPNSDREVSAAKELNRLLQRIAELERQAVAAFKAGYAQGHNDTVEGCYCLDEDMKAAEYLEEVTK